MEEHSNREKGEGFEKKRFFLLFFYPYVLSHPSA
jgi:hypothetical protein